MSVEVKGRDFAELKRHIDEFCQTKIHFYTICRIYSEMKYIGLYTTQIETEILKHLGRIKAPKSQAKINILRILDLFKGLSQNLPIMQSATEHKIYFNIISKNLIEASDLEGQSPEILAT